MDLEKKTDSGIVLGRKYRDALLDFEGVAYSVTTYLTGCDRVNLSRFNEKGEELIEHYCDVTVVELVDADLEAERSSIAARVEEDPGGSGVGVPKPTAPPR